MIAGVRCSVQCAPVGGLAAKMGNTAVGEAGLARTALTGGDRMTGLYLS